MTGQVARLRHEVDELGTLFEVPSQPTPTNSGIPQQLAAVALQVGVIGDALETEAGEMNAAITAGTATPEQIYAFIAKMRAANFRVTIINGLIAFERAVTIGDMFSMQMLMNHLSQMSEMSTAVVTHLNQVLIDMGRDPKGA